MVGIIVAAHKNLSMGLIEAARSIMRLENHLMPVSFEHTDSPGNFSQRLQSAVERVDEGEGVLVLTDMYGDGPTNAALRLAARRRLAVVTGVNLPMLIEALCHYQDLGLAELAARVEQRSRAFIVNAVDYQQRRQERK